MKKLSALLICLTLSQAQAAKWLPLFSGNGALTLFDNFGFSGSHYANSTVMNGQTPLIGPNWLTTGGVLPTITGGQLTNTGLGYLYTNLSQTPQTLCAQVSFTGGTTLSQQPFAFAWSNQTPPTLTIKQLEHQNFGPQLFTYGTFDASSNFVSLMSGSWTTPVSNDGSLHTFCAGIKGETAIVVGPNNEKFCVSDPTISEWVGPMVFWEPITEADGLAAQATLAYAGNNLVTSCGTTTWNPNDNEGGLTLSNGNLTATATSSTGSAEVRSIAGRTNGLVYFEATWVNVQGPTVTAIGLGIGSLAEHTLSPSVGIGGDTKSLGFFTSTSQSTIFQNNGGTGTTNFGSGMGPANGTVYGFALNLTTAKMWVQRISPAGAGWNNASIGTQNPATGTGGVAIDIGGEPFGLDIQFFTSGDVVTINTGGSAFVGTPPSGFVDYLEP